MSENHFGVIQSSVALFGQLHFTYLDLISDPSVTFMFFTSLKRFLVTICLQNDEATVETDSS